MKTHLGAGSDDLRTRLAQIVHVVTGQDPAEVQPDRTFVNDLGVDSLAMVEILAGAAHQLDVHIADDDARRFVRVRDLVEYLQERI